MRCARSFYDREGGFDLKTGSDITKVAANVTGKTVEQPNTAKDHFLKNQFSGQICEGKSIIQQDKIVAKSR